MSKKYYWEKTHKLGEGWVVMCEQLQSNGEPLAVLFNPFSEMPWSVQYGGSGHYTKTATEALNWIEESNKSRKMKLSAPLDLYDYSAKEECEAIATKQVKDSWIPCSERLPELGVNVLVCLYDNRRKKVSKYPDGRKKTIRIDKLDNHCADAHENPFWAKGNTPNVIAWMPLPDVYKGDE